MVLKSGSPGGVLPWGLGAGGSEGTSPCKPFLPRPQHWTDEFLRWDPARFDNVTQISLPVESIWVPDILINEL